MLRVLANAAGRFIEPHIVP